MCQEEGGCWDLRYICSVTELLAGRGEDAVIGDGREVAEDAMKGARRQQMLPQLAIWCLSYKSTVSVSESPWAEVLGTACGMSAIPTASIYVCYTYRSISCMSAILTPSISPIPTASMYVCFCYTYRLHRYLLLLLYLPPPSVPSASAIPPRV